MKKYFFDEGDIQHTHQYLWNEFTYFDLMFGYKKAAEEIFQSIRQTIRGGYSDEILYPLLLIYVHIIECGLKLILARLKHHKEEENCPFLKNITMPSSIEPNHKIDKLDNTLNNILNAINEKNLHYFLEYSLLHSVVSQFVEAKITSVSMRYNFSLNNQQFNTKSKGVDLWSLHEDLMLIFDCIINYIESPNFKSCSLKHFDKIKIQEFKKIFKVLKKYNIELGAKDYKFTEPSEPITLGNCDFSNYNDNRIKINEALEAFNSHELSYIVMGLYFGSISATEINHFNFYNKWKSKEKIIKIQEKTSNILQSIAKVEKYIIYLEKYTSSSD